MCRRSWTLTAIANAARQVYEQQLYAITEDDPDAASKREYAQAQIAQYQAQANDAWDWLKQNDRG